MFKKLAKHNQLRLLLFTLLVASLAVSAVSSVSPAQAGAFSSPFFRRQWQRADYPVAISATQRGFTWGPEPFFSSFEPYVESPNGQRRVEYFDKARMEITQPGYDQSNEYYVTNGLIVKEMLTGEMQTGDESFVQRYPAYNVPIAGDLGDNSVDTATYASFYALANFYATLPPTSITGTNQLVNLLVKQPDRTNERVNQTINRSGVIGLNDALGGLEGVNYTYYERTLGHNIPKVFNDYLNQTGQIYDGTNLVFGNVFNWVNTMGYPITDAYWTRANVNGITRDIMVQLYERRILTYTPTNPDPYKVEMGNVGRHYYNWRYSSKYDLSIPIQSSTIVKPEAGFPGVTISIKALRFIAKESIATTVVTPDGQPAVGVTVTAENNQTGFTFFYVYAQTNANTPPGLYTIYFKGQTSGNEAKAYFFVVGIPGFNLPPQ